MAALDGSHDAGSRNTTGKTWDGGCAKTKVSEAAVCEEKGGLEEERQGRLVMGGWLFQCFSVSPKFMC